VSHPIPVTRDQSRRRFGRFGVTVPLTVLVHRPGAALRVQGRSVEIGAGGLRGALAGELLHGERVEVEFALPPSRSALRLPVVVRHQQGQEYGFEFLSLKRDQQQALQILQRHAGAGLVSVVSDPETKASITAPPKLATVVCASCGSEFTDDKVICFNCGTPAKSAPEPEPVPKEEKPIKLMRPSSWVSTWIPSRYRGAGSRVNTAADSIIAILFVFTLAIGLWEWLNAPSKAEPEHSVQVSFSDVLLEFDPLPSGAAVKKTAVSVSRDAAESASRRKSSSRWRINFETPPIGTPGSASAEPRRPTSAEAPRYYFSSSAALSQPQPSPPSKGAVNESPAPRAMAMAAAPSAPDLNPAPQPAGSSTLMQRPEHWSGAGLQLVDRVLPHYPRLAESERLQGEVVLLATIGRDGTVADVRPVSGPPVLAASAVDAVRQWHFRPYEVDGRAVQVQTNIRVNFALPK
jgi:TonB family protein